MSWQRDKIDAILNELRNFDPNIAWDVRNDDMLRPNVFTIAIQATNARALLDAVHHVHQETEEFDVVIVPVLVRL